MQISRPAAHDLDLIVRSCASDGLAVRPSLCASSTATLHDCMRPGLAGFPDQYVQLNKPSCFQVVQRLRLVSLGIGTVISTRGLALHLQRHWRWQ